MIDRGNWLPLLAGFAIATALALAAGTREAAAQSRVDTTISAPPAPVAVPPPGGGRRPAADEPSTTTPGRPPTIADVERRQAQSQGRTPTSAAIDDGDDDTDAADGDRPAAATRRVPVDGDFSDPVAAAPIDGISATGEPPGQTDGVNPVENDQRSTDDAAPFVLGGDDFDPNAFSLEVQPILDRRPRTLFRFEPFTPKGIRAGTFVILPELELGGFWNSNVLRSSTRPRSDFAFDVKPNVRIVSNWRQHAVEFRARGNLSAFSELTTENDRAYTLEARGRYDITRRSNIEGLVSRDVSQESRSSIDASRSTGPRADVTTDTAAVTFNQRFNRLSVQLRGSLIDQKFDNSTSVLNIGSLSISSRNVKTTEEAVRATWEFKPTLLAFIESALNQRDYAAISSSDGILRNSDGQRYRAGFGFGTSSQILRGEIALGYAVQRPNDGRLQSVSGFLIDANLGYRFNALTSLLLTARTDITETTLANSAGALSRAYGAELRHAIRRNFIATGSLGLTTLDYSGIKLVERETSGGLGLEYFANETVVLFGGYRHVMLHSTEVARNYNADEFRIGLRLRQ